jgi:hypothetical protein
MVSVLLSAFRLLQGKMSLTALLFSDRIHFFQKPNQLTRKFVFPLPTIWYAFALLVARSHDECDQAFIPHRCPVGAVGRT